MEWDNANKYNSFNSYKGLTYYEKYRKIAAWMAGKGRLPPPIECSFDPIMECNHKCFYCNSKTYLRKAEGQSIFYSWADSEKLIKFLAKWGVEGLCFGGGGESTLNWEIPPMIELAHTKGMQTALVTNGSQLFDDELCEALMESRWVGVSLDAGDVDTFRKIRGVDQFEDIINGIASLVKKKRKLKSKVDIAIKVLVLPQNYDKLYDICRLAKALGVDDFHIRPVDLERKDFRIAQRLNFDMEVIKEQFAKCHKLETASFHVYTVMHKYDENFHVKHDFKKCLASPLVLQVCTDHQCYVCVDHRIEERFKLGAVEDIEKWWGSAEHRKLIKSINPLKECSRCTWSEYNKQLLEVVIHDRMCRNFP